MAFTDDDIQALLEIGRFNLLQSVELITRALAARRDKIVRTYFNKVLALDNFHIEDGHLQFEDLAVKHGFAEQRSYIITWSRFDNQTEQESLLSGETAFRLPQELIGARVGSFYSARILSKSGSRKSVTVYLRKKANVVEVIGIERGW